ncbi:hypothetical protein D4T97_014350 [Siminovitchia acidinfaciens]|uniref:Cysteine-rich CWC n=1 Tax=Siminovitchia acidinfaciens TaxID=2321395 RepID=A0A429XXC2_9BACI|nr:cysteine-rich CWC family protein [Siminovitchia acidinfaciens]RST73142.1 hypothetical protein D4T97_014350 [Siminovitchia acidinfaciens]
MQSKEEKCPFCGKGNNCCNTLDKNLGICWCSKESFPQGIFELLPADQVIKVCICKSCLDEYKKHD